MPSFSHKLLKWYSQHARVLPWRDHPDPYAVWVSEIMLQQTRVETVIPYFEKWMKRFPSIPALAAATEQEVLKTWEGLGYYSRARNLHRAAQKLAAEYNGELPRDSEALRKLPGVGRYTAGAIASMAFGADEAALDGNIRRVLARLFDINERVDTPEGMRRLWLLAEENLPAGHAGDYNQAMMDLGASICLPKNPRCLICPLTEICLARQNGSQDSRPILKTKAEIPHYTVTAAVLVRDGKVLLAQRPREKLLGGMWEFPGGKVEAGESLQDCLRREIREELATDIRVGNEVGVYQHAYTHFRITVHAFRCELTGKEPHPVEATEIAWLLPEQMQNYPMGKVDRLIARAITPDGDTISG